MLKVRIASLTAAICVVATGSALADDSRTISQRGDVSGDARASVRLVVVVADGAPKSVKNVRFKDLRMHCTKGKARVDLNLSGAAKLRADRTFETVYGEGRSRVKLAGKVRRDGRRVAGQLSGRKIRVSGVGRCRVPEVEFVTKA